MMNTADEPIALAGWNIESNRITMLICIVIKISNLIYAWNTSSCHSSEFSAYKMTILDQWVKITRHFDRDRLNFLQLRLNVEQGERLSIVHHLSKGYQKYCDEQRSQFQNNNCLLWIDLRALMEFQIDVT